MQTKNKAVSTFVSSRYRIAKNQTDGADAVEHIPFRYVVALSYPITATLKPFLARGDHPSKAVDKMHAAWRKAVLMQVILWSHPYIKTGDL